MAESFREQRLLGTPLDVPARRSLRRGRDVTPRRLLDVGSGAGHWVQYFHTRHQVALEDVTALDIAAAALGYVAARFPAVRRVVGSLAEPELDVGGPYDLATAVGVLHHLMTPAALGNALATLVGTAEQVVVYPLHRPEAQARYDHVRNKRYWTASDYEDALERASARAGLTLRTASQPWADKTAVLRVDRVRGEVVAHLPQPAPPVQADDEDEEDDAG